MDTIQKRIIKNIWRTLNWAFNNFDNYQEYDDYCDCVYFSEASRWVDRDTFERMMAATMY